MTYNIRINSPEDAQKLNKIAEKMPFDIWIHGKSGNADAKSLLGMMLLSSNSSSNKVYKHKKGFRSMTESLFYYCADFL